MKNLGRNFSAVALLAAISLFFASCESIGQTLLETILAPAPSSGGGATPAGETPSAEAPTTSQTESPAATPPAQPASTPSTPAPASTPPPAAPPTSTAPVPSIPTSTVPAGWEGAVLTIGRAAAKRGEEATVMLNLVHPGLAGFHIDVRYDGRRLRVDSPASVTRERGGLRLISYMGVSQDTYSQNPFSVLWYDASNDRTTGDILSVRFTVLPDAPAGEAVVNVTVRGSNNSDLTRIPIAVASGGVTIVE